MANSGRMSGFRPLEMLERMLSRRSISSTAIGYDSGEPAARTVQGDENFPFFKDPADVAEARSYFHTSENGDVNAIPTATDFSTMLALGSIDVRGYRTLTLYVDFRGIYGQGEGLLPTIGLVPQSAIVFEGNGTRQWVNYGVVDPFLRGSGFDVLSTETSLEARSTAYRDCFIAQMDLSFTWDKPNSMMLVFDVVSIAEARFLIGSVARTSDDTPVEGINAALYYQLGR